MITAPKLRKTFGDLRRQAVTQLREANIESAETDARLLLCRAAGIDTAKLISSESDHAPHDVATKFPQLVERRISGEPVSRILGEKEFWSLRFLLGSETLVPRPETETVVEAGLEGIRDRQRALRILDLGTGSGAILAALLSELPNATGIAIDKNEAALAVARENMRSLSLESRVSFACGDWANALSGTFDLIVSNPPYIASNEIALLSPEVRDHDPRLALEGGADGLEAYRTVVEQLGELLAESGKAVLELGQGQEESVSALVLATGRLAVAGKARPDLAGIPRALVIHVKR